MAKGKDFSRSLGSKRLNTLIPTENEVSQKEGIQEKISPPKKGDQTTVTTFRIENENLLKIKAIAFWDRKKIQDVFNEALSSYIDSIESGEVDKAVEEYVNRNK